MRQVVTLLISTIGVLAYTRLLQPEDLGAVALAFLVYSGLLLLVQAPIRDAVVYYQEGEAAYSSAAFWLLLVFGALSLGLVLVLARPLGRFYDSIQAAALTRAIAVAFFFDALAVVPGALLLKHFRFAIHESLQTVYVLILLVGWVALAANGWGAWSLILPQIAGAVFWAAATWLAAGFRPLLRPGREAYRGIVRFSRSLLGSNFVVYLKANLDQAAVGTLGEAPLGWYSFGESQSAFAVLGVGLPVARVALPAMAEVQTRLDEVQARLAEVRRVYLEMLRLAATLGTPWLGAVVVFRAYLTFRLIQTLLSISDAVVSALGRPQIRFAVDLAQLPFFVAGVWFGLRVWGGIEGVAWSLAIVRSLAGLVYLVVSMRLTRLSAGTLVRYLLPSSLASLLMGLLVYGLRSSGWVQAWLATENLLGTLLVLVLMGVTSYFLALYALDRSSFRQVRAMAWRVAVPGSVRDRLARLL
jgi:PST family polysaccharide transporter